MLCILNLDLILSSIMSKSRHKTLSGFDQNCEGLAAASLHAAAVASTNAE